MDLLSGQDVRWAHLLQFSFPHPFLGISEISVSEATISEGLPRRSVSIRALETGLGTLLRPLDDLPRQLILITLAGRMAAGGFVALVRHHHLVARKLPLNNAGATP